MSRPVSSRRCPLARLETVWAASDVDEDLVALGVSLVRQIRGSTRGASAPVRMAQSLACMTWWKVMTDGGDLLTLNRALGEFTRTFRALGMRAPAGGNRGAPQDYGRDRSVFSVRSSPARQPEDDDEGR